jgi:hypothetical protein
VEDTIVGLFFFLRSFVHGEGIACVTTGGIINARRRGISGWMREAGTTPKRNWAKGIRNKEEGNLESGRVETPNSQHVWENGRDGGCLRCGAIVVVDVDVVVAGVVGVGWMEVKWRTRCGRETMANSRRLEVGRCVGLRRKREEGEERRGEERGGEPWCRISGIGWIKCV